MTAFLEAVPREVNPERRAEAWCELGRALEESKQKSKALQCYDTGVSTFPYYPDCHLFACRALGKGNSEKKAACLRYLQVAPRGEAAAEVKRLVKRLE